MSDAELRALERRARMGDIAAAVALERGQARLVVPPRDPRVDPRAGDVVERHTPTGQATKRRVVELHGSGTSLYVSWIAGDFAGPDVALTMRGWRRWARGATVIKRGCDTCPGMCLCDLREATVRAATAIMAGTPVGLDAQGRLVPSDNASVGILSGGPL